MEETTKPEAEQTEKSFFAEATEHGVGWRVTEDELERFLGMVLEGRFDE